MKAERSALSGPPLIYELILPAENEKPRRSPCFRTRFRSARSERGIDMSDTLPILYKLMTLYTLSRVDFALTNRQISNVFLDLGYTHYFNVQYTLGDLVESGLIREDVYPNCIYYSLTEEGLKSLEALKNNISSGIRGDIDCYLKKNRLEFREAVSKKADYYRTAQDDIAVRCQVLEHTTPLIDLTITVPNERQAKIICKNWKEHSQEIYSYIYRSLTRSGTQTPAPGSGEELSGSSEEEPGSEWQQAETDTNTEE